MGVRILSNEDDTNAVLYCSTSDWARGPVFYGTDSVPASDLAAKFCDWLGTDYRHLSDTELERKYSEFVALGWKACRGGCFPEELITVAAELCEECRMHCALCGEVEDQIKVYTILGRKRGLCDACAPAPAAAK